MAAVDELVTHRQWVVDGLRLHVAEAGAGPAVVLLHGFPDFWFTWRHQIPALVEAGFRVLAPDLRGYAGTEAPRGVRPYRLERLVADVVGLIAAAGEERVVLVGHDWGGEVAWTTAALHPERVSRLAVCNMPHPQRFRQALRTRRQLGRSWYIGLFQLPVVPELLFGLGRGWGLRRVLRDGTLDAGAFTDADLDRYVEALLVRGSLTGPLNYYRAAVRRALRGDEVLEAGARVSCPVLVLWGEQDLALTPGLAEPPPALVPDVRVVRYPDAGHWVHLDAPGPVSEQLVAFAAG
jgi:epoxide hydrolase 4